MPIIMAGSNELYIVKGGVIQSGFSFSVDQIAYSSSSNAAHSSTATMQTGYIQVRANANGSTRGGSAYRMTTNISSIIGNYSTLHIKCRRICYNNTNYYNKLGTYNPNISGSYSNAKFLDSITKQGGSSDSSAVTLDIPLTSTTYNAGTVVVCFAYTSYVGRTTGVDIYDIWLT